MKKLLYKGRTLAIMFVACLVLVFLGVSLLLGIGDKTKRVSAASNDSIFTFTPISETECNVRLSDKTVKEAIIPYYAEIDGKEYEVTTIVANGFASASNLEKVRLPKAIKTIGQAAFSNCTSLNSITLPAVESIGTNAFAKTSMEYIVLPKTLKTVAATILRNAATKVYVKAALAEGKSTPDGNWASNWNAYNSNQDVEFDSDFEPEIKYIHLSEVLAEAGVSAFGEVEGYVVDGYQEFVIAEEDDYREVYIPAKHTDIDGNEEPVVGLAQFAFWDNEINKLTIGYADTAINITSSSFDGLIGDEIIINRDVILDDTDWDGTSIIANNVFANSTVSTIYLPNTITALGANMFMNCTNLRDIHFIQPTQYENSDDELGINQSSTKNVSLPNTITSIGEEAFSGITEISELVIPSTVIMVGQSILNGWGKSSMQVVKINYNSESDLPDGWNPLWKAGCNSEIIEFQGKFTISYVLNGGSDPGNPTEYTSSDTIILEDSYLDGNTFAGWYSNEEFDGEPISVIGKGSSGDLMLYAKFIHNTYKVVYKPNKPTKASSEVEGLTYNSHHEYSVEAPLSQNGFSLNGWGFIGWNTEDDGTGEAYTDRQTVLNLTKGNNDEFVLYAQWMPNSYNVIYIPNKPYNATGLMSGDMSNSVHIYDETQTLSPIGFALEGWNFVGWNTQADGQGESYSDNDAIYNLRNGGSVNLYAQWSSIIYSVIYDGNKPSHAHNEIVGVMNNSNFIYEETCTLSDNAFSLMGWRFTGWNTLANGTGVTYNDKATVKNLTSATSITLYAQWDANFYEIIYDSNSPSPEFGTVSGQMSNTTYYYDNFPKLNQNVYTLTPPQGVEYSILEIVGWTESRDGEVKYSIDASAGEVNIGNGNTITLYAVWDYIEYKIYLNWPDGYMGEYINTYNYSEEKTVIAMNWDDYSSHIPVGFNYQSFYTIPLHSTGDQYITIEAWEITYTVHFNISANMLDGTVQGLPGGETLTLTYNESFSYSAQDMYGYQFKEYKLSKRDPLMGNLVDEKIFKERDISLTHLTKEDNAVFYLACIYTQVNVVSSGPCVTEGTLITLADGTQKAVEQLNGDEMLLVWDFQTGTFNAAPILFIDSDPASIYEVTNLYFSDGTGVKVIYEHAFWDFDLNQYVFLRNDAVQYIGHWFNKQTTDENGQLTWTKVQLTNVIVKDEYTTSWSPVTFGHLCYYVNGMLSMPGATEGLINIFEVDAETMSYNQEAFFADIERYGLYTYEEFAGILSVSQEVFEAFNGQYLKVSIGKGLIDIETLTELLERYSKYLVG